MRRQNANTITTFGQALAHVMLKMRWSPLVMTAAMQCSEAEWKKWLAGTSYPTGKYLALVKGKLPGIRPYLHLIPREKPEHPVVEQRIEIIAEPNPPDPAPDEVAEVSEPPIDFSTFGHALRDLRLNNELEASDVAQMCDTDAVTILAIEAGHDPIAETVYQQLVTLFDDLNQAPKPRLNHLQLVPDMPEAPTLPATSDDVAGRWAAAAKKAALGSRKVKKLEAELAAARSELEMTTLERDILQREIEQAALAEEGE